MNSIKNALIHSVLFIAAVLAVFPILVVFSNSFMSGFELVNRYSQGVRVGNELHTTVIHTGAAVHYVRLTLIPSFASVEQYAGILFRQSFYLEMFWNSIVLAFPIVAGQLLISAPAAYAFHFSRLRFKEGLYFIYIIFMLLPLQIVLVPHFIVADWLGMLDSRWAIVLPAMVNPLGVFIIRQYMRGLTLDYIEAAQIDGAGQLRILATIVAPLIKPAFAALAILCFVENWNLVEQPLIFLTEYQFPLSLYLARMAEGHMNIIFSASFLYLLPPVLIYLYWNEHMVEGIILSGVK